MFRAVCGLPSRRVYAPAPIRRPAARPLSPASGFLHVEVDGSKKATGRFILFSDGQVLTGTLEGAPESLNRFVNVSLRTHPGSGRGTEARKLLPFTASHARFEACDH